MDEVDQQNVIIYKYTRLSSLKKSGILALAGVVQWNECQPANQKVIGSIPSQSTCLGCRLGPQ